MANRTFILTTVSTYAVTGATNVQYFAVNSSSTGIKLINDLKFEKKEKKSGGGISGAPLLTPLGVNLSVRVSLLKCNC